MKEVPKQARGINIGFAQVASILVFNKPACYDWIHLIYMWGSNAKQSSDASSLLLSSSLDSYCQLQLLKSLSIHFEFWFLHS